MIKYSKQNNEAHDLKTVFRYKEVKKGKCLSFKVSF